MQTSCPIVKLQNTFNLIIPSEVEKIIRHLCNKIHTIEWSGILFYTYTGSWENNDLEITCVDILPMDIGSAGYTEFNMSPEVISYMTDHDLLDCECGLIHSHNTMAAFFSGTDIDTLKKEGIDRNHFVSLIVNNDGNYVAAITRKANINKVSNVTASYNTFNNEEIKTSSKDNIVEEYTQVQYKMLDVIKEGSTDSFDEIDARLKEIKDSKERKYKSNIVAKKDNIGYYQPSLFDFPYKDSDEDAYYDDWYDKFDKKNNMQDITKKTDIEENFINLTAARIMLSSMSVNPDIEFDFEKWAKEIDKLYAKIFPDTDRFKFWIEMFAEYAIYESIPEELLEKYNTTTDYIGESNIYGIVELYQSLPKSKYLDIIINVLTNMCDGF